jgi:ABC-type lipoprotein export system ATPase subunit
MRRAELLKAIADTYGSDTELLLKELAAQHKPAAKKGKKMTDPPLIDVSDVTKTYKLGKTIVNALQGVSTVIHPGEIVALTGPSGSGKSTLLHLIAGLDHPTSGTVTVNDNRVDQLKGKALSQYRAQQLGFVFQFFYLQPFLTLTTNVQVPTMFVPMEEAERTQRAAELIEAVGLSDRAAHLPRELSGGQMQRAAIARALVNHAPLILADEPTGNLDSTNADAIMDLFEEIRQTRNTIIIVVTHDERVSRRADRIITLKDGRLV